MVDGVKPTRIEREGFPLPEEVSIDVVYTGDDVDLEFDTGTPAAPATGGIGPILVEDTPAGSPLVFADLLQNEEGTDLLYADAV